MGFPKQKSQITYDQKNILVEICKKHHLDWTNYYEQFGWNVPDNLSYVWGNSL